MDQYFLEYGPFHVENAKRLLKPLHTPGEDEPIDFSDIQKFNPERTPYPAQAHVITSIVKGMQKGRGGFIGAELGTGKTLMACLAAYKLLGGKGRVVVMCPDHIIDKWVDEIKTTVPNATVVSFDNWKEVVHYYWKIGDFRSVPAMERALSKQKKSWIDPKGIEFVVLGRDQSKYMPNSPNIGEPKLCFDGITRALGGSCRRPVGFEDVRDEHGMRVWDSERSGYKRKAVVENVYRCPKCGASVIDKRKGVPVDVAKSASGMRCSAKYAKALPNPDSPEQGLDRIGPLDGRFDSARPGKLVRLSDIWHGAPNGSNKYVIRECGEPLWNYTGKPRRWAPAQFMFTKMRGCFDLAIIDEVHEEKGNQNGDVPAQALSAWRLMSISKKVLALTGTLIGGYAWHLFPLLMTVRPKQLLEEGIKWGQAMEFSRRYGRVDRFVKLTTEEGSTGSSRSRRSSSLRRARNGTAREYHKIAPGVMPSLYARHLLGCSAFLSMEQLAEHMPPLDEQIIGVDMSPELEAEVTRIADACDEANKTLLRSKCMSFLGATIATTMEYPDHPWGWTPDFEGHPSVGYWKQPRPAPRTVDNWVGVITPKDLPKDVIYPKEAKLIEICKRERDAGNQVWVYANMTGKRDVQPRLVELLEKAGLRAGILRAKNVKPRDRIEWIEKHGNKFDVMISHPKPVMTGLDLLSKNPGGHNFSSIVFYATGTHAFVCKQASRRSWRLIQRKKCRIYYLYYTGTVQHRMVALMAKKFAAMGAVGGDFSTEGLIAMGGVDDGSLALCQSLDRAIDDNLLRVNWAKATGAWCDSQEEGDRQDSETLVPDEEYCWSENPLGDEEQETLLLDEPLIAEVDLSDDEYWAITAAEFEALNL